jgi:hypothetical protein
MLQEEQGRNLRAAYLDSLPGLIPEYNKVRSNPDFSKWLQDESADSSYTRLELLREADSRRDAKAVAKIYRAFAGSQSAPEVKGSIKPEAKAQMGTRADRATPQPQSREQKPLTAADILNMGKSSVKDPDAYQRLQDMFSLVKAPAA